MFLIYKLDFDQKYIHLTGKKMFSGCMNVQSTILGTEDNAMLKKQSLPQ